MCLCTVVTDQVYGTTYRVQRMTSSFQLTFSSDFLHVPDLLEAGLLPNDAFQRQGKASLFLLLLLVVTD